MRKFAFLLLAVVLVVGAWAAGWFYAASEVRATVAALGEGPGDAPTLTCDGLEITGFPFRLDVSCTGATLVDGDITATLAGLRASVMLYNPTHARLSAQAPVTVADAFTGSRGRLEFTSADASIRFHIDNPLAALEGEDIRLARASLVAEGLSWTDTLAGETLRASAGRAELHLLDIPERYDPAHDVSALAVYATAGAVMAPDFGIADGDTSVEAEISGLPGALAGFTAPAPLRRWREAGGVLELLGLEGSAGPDYFEASGSLTLDAQARPEGQLRLTSRGLVERLGGLVPPEWQRLVLGAQAEDGSYTQTLTLRGGIVLAGLIPVAPLPSLI